MSCRIIAIALVAFAISPFAIAPQPASAESQRPDPDALEPIAVNDLLVRDKGSIDIEVVNKGLTVFVAEELRRNGLNVVGYENVVFGVDKSDAARFLLGGTVVRASCDSTNRPGLQVCHLAITWELFDPRAEKVLYRMTTRSLTAMGERLPFGPDRIREALSAQLHTLCERPRFARLLAKGGGGSASREAPVLTIGEVRACGAKARALPRDLSKALDAAVVVRNGNGLGSGTVISDDGIILTAAHVVGNSTEVEVSAPGGETHKARVLRTDPLQDFAILAADGRFPACLPLADGLPAVGDELFAVGAPASSDLAFSVSKGIVSGVRRVDDAIFIQTDAALNPGNSGGAVLDRAGRIVGVVSWGLNRRGFEGLGFAAPAALALPRLGLRAGESTNVNPVAASAAARTAPPVQETIVESEPPIPWRVCVDPQTCVSTKEMLDANRK